MGRIKFYVLGIMVLIIVGMIIYIEYFDKTTKTTQKISSGNLLQQIEPKSSIPSPAQTEKLQPATTTKPLKTAQAENISPNLESKPYFSSKGKFQINPPEGWIVDESGLAGMDIIFKNTKTEMIGKAPFTANITVDTEPTSGRSIQQCAETIKQGMPLIWTGYKLVEDKNVVISDNSAIIIGGKFTLKSLISEDTAEARNLQLLVEDGKGTLFTVTATALESTWYEYKDTLESSLLSLRLLE